MVDIIADDTQLSIFNYTINKRFNFCLDAKVLEILDILYDNDGIYFKFVKNIKLSDKQVQILSKYTQYYI